MESGFISDSTVSMESGFISDSTVTLEYGSDWQSTSHVATGRYEYLKLRSFGALYFVKRPTPSYRGDLLTVQALEKEYQLGHSLNHPSIVKYIKMEDGAVYQEYIDGITLREMIDKQDHRLSSPQFIENICRQLLEATSYIHSQRVIHNDIKPENIMITRIGEQLKLVDFGCATTDMWDVAEGYTAAYKAPEQGVESTNIHTDIYLVGKVMKELAPLAKVENRWKEFINRATFKVPRFRYTDDKAALKAIPTGKVKGLFTFLFGLGLIILYWVLSNQFLIWVARHILAYFGIDW